MQQLIATISLATLIYSLLGGEVNIILFQVDIVQHIMTLFILWA